MKRTSCLLLTTLVLTTLSLAQKTVVLIDQNGNPVQRGHVRMTTATDTITLDVQTDRFTMPVDLSGATPVTLEIDGIMIQPWFNQYMPEQLWWLDTIRVHYSNRCFLFDPIFVAMKIFATDAASIDTPDWSPYDWFPDYLATVEPSASCFELVVFNTSPLSADLRRRYVLFRKAFCTHFTIPEENVRLVFSEKPYTCTRFDFFPSGTVITPAFVAGQHTGFMRRKAEEYILGVQVIVTGQVYRDE
jgi:hypothetical protein